MTAGEVKRVKEVAKSTSVSMTPVRPGKTYPLSPLDHAMAAHTLHLVFYYKAGPEMEEDKLKESLSDVLSHYPAMAGRLVRGEKDGNWVVKCNDAGVRVVDAKAGVTLERWLETATAEEEMDLAHWEPMVENTSIWSPFYIQVSTLPSSSTSSSYDVILGLKLWLVLGLLFEMACYSSSNCWGWG